MENATGSEAGADGNHGDAIHDQLRAVVREGLEGVIAAAARADVQQARIDHDALSETGRGNGRRAVGDGRIRNRAHREHAAGHLAEVGGVDACGRSRHLIIPRGQSAGSAGGESGPLHDGGDADGGVRGGGERAGAEEVVGRAHGRSQADGAAGGDIDGAAVARAVAADDEVAGVGGCGGDVLRAGEVVQAEVGPDGIHRERAGEGDAVEGCGVVVAAGHVELQCGGGGQRAEAQFRAGTG